MPLWHKNYFEQKAFEFLIFFYLPKNSFSKELSCPKSLPGEQQRKTDQRRELPT